MAREDSGIYMRRSLSDHNGGLRHVSFGAVALGVRFIRVVVLNNLRDDLELNRNRGRLDIRGLHTFVQHDFGGGTCERSGRR